MSKLKNPAQALRGLMKPASGQVARLGAPTAEALAAAYAELQSQFAALQAKCNDQEALINSLQNATGVDTLTGLANRRSLSAELEKSLANARRHNRTHALVRLEVADFAPLAERFGQTAAEALLAHVARLLRQNIRPTDIAGRLGQGDFVVILNELRAAAHGPQRALGLAEVLEHTPCVLPSHTLSLTIRSACHVFGAEDDLNTLLAHATQPCSPTPTALT